MEGNYFFDLRNIYVKNEVEEIGLEYIGVGLAQTISKRELEKARRDVAVAEGEE